MKRLFVLLAAGVLTGALLVPAAPASAAVADACVGSSGVTVVVDFSAFGQGIRVVCVSSVPSTGLGALRAYFSTVGTTHDGPGYVCRINGLPTADTEACVVTPPTTAYWSYWHAARGGSWSYSTSGAANYHPEPGTVEGWAFGSGGAPRIAPPAPIAEPAPPPPPPPQPTTARPPAGGGGGGGGGGDGTTEAESSPPAESPSDSPSATTSSAPTPSSSTVDVVADPAPPPGDERSGGLGTVVGLVLVVGLAAGAATIALRRRHAMLGRDPSYTETVNKGPLLSSDEGDPEG
jgi:hypothetical protein